MSSFLEKLGIKTKIHLRLTNTAERHAGFSKIFSLPQELALSNRQQNAVTAIGVETQSYLDEISTLVKSPILVPTPPAQIRGSEMNSSLQVTVGFLGSPQSQKRLELLCKIIEDSLAKRQEILHWFLQLPKAAKGPHIADADLQRLELRRGFIEDEIFDRSLSKLDALCIPYDPAAYRQNASALMYRASDHSVPVICFRGSAFAEEVEKFNLGWVVDNIEDMVTVISTLQSGIRRQFYRQFLIYNQVRLEANVHFLGIDEQIEI
jgi:glycosyltransferase involved in cell wall biosynthesis